MRLSPYLFVLIFICYSCKAQERVSEVRHSDRNTTFLLDSAAAAKFILLDHYDRFFERVTPVEMSVQMHQPLNGQEDTVRMRAAFAAYLQTDVDSFSAKESKWLADIMKKVYETCNSVHPGIFPDSLLLIKTKANHYGEGVYYTRGKCIVIPVDALKKRDKAALTSTIYHEIFHVYSRLNPAKRQQLYQLIGFNYIGLDNLIFPSPLDGRILHNPDGVDFGQKITLKLDENETIEAVPIIYANRNGYSPEAATFFSYLEFNLFKVEPAGDNKWAVITENDGLSSTINIAQIPDFYKQIKDNTTYIIHPDEVLADNFSFIMLDIDGQQASIRFSKEGKQLLKDIDKILRQ